VGEIYRTVSAELAESDALRRRDLAVAAYAGKPLAALSVVSCSRLYVRSVNLIGSIPAQLACLHAGSAVTACRPWVDEVGEKVAGSVERAEEKKNYQRTDEQTEEQEKNVPNSFPHILTSNSLICFVLDTNGYIAIVDVRIPPTRLFITAWAAFRRAGCMFPRSSTSSSSFSAALRKVRSPHYGTGCSAPLRN